MQPNWCNSSTNILFYFEAADKILKWIKHTSRTLNGLSTLFQSAFAPFQPFISLRGSLFYLFLSEVMICVSVKLDMFLRAAVWGASSSFSCWCNDTLRSRMFSLSFAPSDLTSMKIGISWGFYLGLWLFSAIWRLFFCLCNERHAWKEQRGDMMAILFSFIGSSSVCGTQVGCSLFTKDPVTHVTFISLSSQVNTGCFCSH